MIESHSAAQIQFFIEEILQPTFKDLLTQLAASDKFITIAENASTGNHAVNEILRQMHPQQNYFTSSDQTSQSFQTAPNLLFPQRWICLSLYIELLAARYEVEFIPSQAQYCLSLEVTITSQHIQAASIVGYRDCKRQTFQMHRAPLETDGIPLLLESIDSSDIILRFVETFEAFQDELSGLSVEQTHRSHSAEPDGNEIAKSWPAFIEPEFVDFLPPTLDKSILIESTSVEPNPADPSQIEPSDLNPPDSALNASLDPDRDSPANPSESGARFSAFEPASDSSSFSLSETSEQISSSVSSPAQSLRQSLKQLSRQLSPPGFPIYSELIPSLSTSVQIKPILDRYQRIVDLSLEYSPFAQESELTEYLSRLGHFQSLKRLAHLHILIQEEIQAWLQKYGYPSAGAIAANLYQRIVEFKDYLDQRVQTLTDQRLETVAAHTLQIELAQLSSNNHQLLLDQLEQNPLLGYLDISLLTSTNNLEQSIDPFTDPNKPVDLPAHHLKNKENKILITLISSCQDEKYQAYLQRKRTQQTEHKFVEYTITQKLYPQRPIFIGPAQKSVHPRLELLWGDAEEPTLDPNPFAQIWCIYPINRTDPPRWIIIAATTEHQPLRTLTLADGQTAQEGSQPYLNEGLSRMALSEDEYTHILGDLIVAALERKQVKYMHIHQTFNSHTAEPGDIVQMQFQLDSNRSDLL